MRLIKKTLVLFTAGLILGFSGLKSQIDNSLLDYGSNGAERSFETFKQAMVRCAEDDLRDITKIFPDNPSADDALILRANIDFASENYTVADGRLREFISLRKNSPLIPHAALLRAYMAFDQKKYPESVKLFAEAKTLAVDEAELRDDSVYFTLAHKALYWGGLSLTHQSRYEDARPLFEECFVKYPKGQYADDALFALGMIAEISRNYEMSVNYYSTVARKYPFSNSYIASRVREINNRLILRSPEPALVAMEKTNSVISHIVMKDSLGLLFEEQLFANNAAEQLQYLRGEAYNLAGNHKKAFAVFKAYLETFYDSDLSNYVRLGAGRSLLIQGKNHAAMVYYNEIINNDFGGGTNVKDAAKLYRIVALKRSGDLKQTEKELSALSVQPDYHYTSQVLLELGQLYYEAGKYQDAKRILERAVREANEAIVAERIHLLLGASYLELRLWSEAVKEYRAAEKMALRSSYMFMPKKDFYLSEARFKRGYALVQSQRNGEAIPAFLAYIAETKDESRTDEALFWLAEAYYRSDLLNNSADTYASLLKRYPKSDRREEALYGQGWSHFRLRKFNKSSKIFDKMIGEYPDSKFALEVLARQADGYYKTRNFRSAANSYRKAARRAPKTEEGKYCAYQLCHSLYRLGSYEEAVSSLLNFVRMYPRSSLAAHALYLNGWIRFEQREYIEAIDDFRFLITAYSKSDLVPQARYTIANAFYNLGRYDDAITAYNVVVNDYPSSGYGSAAVKSLQDCYRVLGQDSMAIHVADVFVETNPNSPFAPEFKITKAEMFYNGRQYPDAVKEYQAFIAKYPNSERSSEALLMMGRSYIKLNELDKAEKAFLRLKKSYPNSDNTPLGILELSLMKKEQGDIRFADSLMIEIEKDYPSHDAASQAGFERAVIKQEIGDTIGAIDLYRVVSEKYRGKAYADQALFRMGMYFRSKSMYDSAKTIFAELAAKEYNEEMAAECSYHIGELNMREKNYKDAAKAFEAVRDKFDGIEDWYSLSLLSLGECYEHEEDYEAAREIYLVLQSIRFEDEFAKTAEQRLKRIKKLQR